MLSALLHKYGMTAGSIAALAEVSDTAVRNWMAGQTPSSENAVAVASLFNLKDGAGLLRHWGYEAVAASWDEVAPNMTREPNVANGWRLDTLIAEQRETNKILNRIEQHLAPSPPEHPGAIRDRMKEESNE